MAHGIAAPGWATVCRAAGLSSSFALMCLFSAPTASHAGTMFTAVCAGITNLSAPTCTQSALDSYGYSATLTFPNIEPIDGTAFSDPATLDISMGAYSRTVTLPSYSYAYVPYFAFGSGTHTPGTTDYILRGGPTVTYNVGPDQTFWLNSGFPNIFTSTGPYTNLLTAFASPSLSPTTVYLDFGANLNAVFDGFSKSAGGYFSDTFSKVSSGLDSIADSITSKVKSLFTKYLVDFTNTPPSSGNDHYYTVYVGGNASDLPSTLQNHLTPPLMDGVHGISPINAGNTYSASQPTNKGIVFSGDDVFHQPSFLCLPGFDCLTVPSYNNEDLLAQVIAHETGHLLGLLHVSDPSQLMYPYTPPPRTWDGDAATIIGGSSPIFWSPGNVGPLSQDSDAFLSCYVGLRSTGSRDCSGLPTTGFINLNILSASTSEMLFDARLYVVHSENIDDLPIGYSLGDLTPGESMSIMLPLLLDDQIFVVGTRTAGGPIETFVSVYSPGGGDNAASLLITDEIIQAVPEPDSVLLLLFSLGVMLILILRQTISGGYVPCSVYR